MRLNIPRRPFAKPPANADTGTESPRSEVAYAFQGMYLKEGASPEDETPEGYPVPKRVKNLGVRSSATIFDKREIPETPPALNFKVAIGLERGFDATGTETTGDSVLRNKLDPIIFKGSNKGKSKPGLSRSYPSINRLSDSKSLSPKKRMGTPPLLGPGESALDAEIDEAESRVVDPDRAALTWHDDEITGHNPSDPEDDGEGINGIGFIPTPAMARARSEKRRQQMAEYRNREAREARAKRSERRRGAVGSKEEREMAKASDSARRVRFLEGMVEAVIPTN